MRIIRRIYFVAFALIGMAGAAIANDEPLWMRYPSISPNGKEIAFAYKGDIYKVPTTGGVATRLTTHEAYDTTPMWSPDGSKIAFVSDRYYGSRDIYVMNANGGAAKRVTTHSTSESILAFSPDGKYIYYTAHIQDPASSALFPTARLNEVYKVPVEGGRSIMVMATPVSMGAISADGRQLIYEDIKGFENVWRKHHTSSVTRDIVLYDFKSKQYKPLATWKGEDRNPVFAPKGNSFYFLSEREGTFNVFKQPLNSSNEKDAVSLTHFKTHPVRFLSVGGDGTLCFGYDGRIYTMKEGSQPQKVAIQIMSDVDEEEITKSTFMRGITSASVSPDGKMLAYVIRGEVFVTSADYSTTKRITDTPEMERSVSFGSDNRSVVYESQRGGKSDIYIAKMARKEDPNFANATLVKEELLIPGEKSEKMHPTFSPDGKYVAIASGILSGLGYQDNTRAALITRGLQEMIRYGVHFGGQQKTFMGLTGIGDLIVTCTSVHSRNFEAGYQIGKENSVENFFKNNTKTVEGVRTAKIVHRVAKENGIDMPICEEVYQILFNGKLPSECAQDLMIRDLKKEF